jgi:PAS domain S-box-containing protein
MDHPSRTQEFEQLVRHLSREFSKPLSGHVRPVANLALGKIAAFLGFDSAVLLHLPAGEGGGRTLASWPVGIPDTAESEHFGYACPWVINQILDGQLLEMAEVETLSRMPPVERALCARHGMRSLWGLPLSDMQGVVAALVLGACQPARPVAMRSIDQAQTLGELVVNGVLQAEREERLSDAIDAAEAGLWSLDYSTRAFWATETARAMHGFDVAEAISVDKVLAAVHPDDRDLIMRTIEGAAGGAVDVNVEYRIPQRDGTLRWLVARGRSYVRTSGRPQQLMGVNLDITERKLAEEALRNARALTDAVFDSVPGMLYLYNAEGRLLRWNKRHEAATGYSAEELMNMPIESMVVEEHHGLMLERMNQVFTEGHATAELDVRLKDGTITPCEATGVLVYIDGKPHMVGISMDVKERKRTEASLAQLRAEMTHVARVNTLGELTSGLAHELNQPLAAILSNAQAARRFLAAQPPNLDEVRDALEDIIFDDKRAGEIVHGLRQMVGKNPIKHEQIDVNALIQIVAGLLHGELITYDIPLTLDLAPDRLMVVAGQTEIQQVLLNYLLNGIQAQYAVAPAARRLVVSSRREHDWVILAVRDGGGGIAVESLHRVFDPFFSTKNDGLGMGLAICRRIAQSYGGRVWAENNPDYGATFFLALPEQGCAE